MLFFIFGYGVPKDIVNDENYNHYLSFVFNRIFSSSAGKKAEIVFCGGKTDCIRPPYARSEAKEMKKLFLRISRRAFVSKKTRAWTYGIVNNTYSTVENILAAKMKAKGRPCVIFCETTRGNRVKKLSRRAFGATSVTVAPVDFDMSPNRYLAPEFLAEREAHDLRHELAALLDKKKLAEWRAYHRKKLAFFREHDYANNPDVVRQWWKNTITGSQ